jgi:hypothetical protein
VAEARAAAAAGDCSGAPQTLQKWARAGLL